jgi:predicted HAD superfamily Cof-like phosphohydrolase
MVKEFHTSFGAFVGTTPQLPELKTRNLRKKILEEEFNEFYEAIEQNDLIEVADALADICYIACGTSISYGITPEKSYEFHSFTKPNNQGREYYLSIMKKVFAYYAFAEALNDLNKIAESLQDILSTCSSVSDDFNIPLQKVFNEVHRSNMTKLDDNGKPIFREDGKIMKSSNYEPPDIKKVLLGDNVIIDGFLT